MDLDRLTPAQQRVADRISRTRGRVDGPFSVLLHVPDLTDRVQQLGAYLRYEASLERDVAELGVLVTAQAHRSHVEWEAHAPLARAAGVPDEVIRIVRDGGDTGTMPARHRAVVEYVQELIGGSDPKPAYGPALDLLGIDGIVELTVLVGYYTMLAMTLSALGVEPTAARTEGTAQPD